SAMKALASAARKFRDVNNSIVAQWPVSVPRPSYHISLRRLGECIRNGFGHPSLIFRQTLQPLPSADLVRRVCDADDRIPGFADGEVRGHAGLLFWLGA